jgi:hypothetical protein
MNIQNIHVGMVIPNYRKLCEILEEPEKTGKSKTYQLREFARHFKFSRNGKSYIIEEIYSTALEKIDNREVGSRSYFVEDLRAQLLHRLSKDRKNAKHNSVFYTANELFEITGMVNDKYVPTKKAIKQFLKENPGAMERFDVDEFYFRTGERLRDILKSTLNSLKNKFAIRYEIKYQIKKGKEWEQATEKEETEIMKAKSEAVKLMKIEDENDPEGPKGERAVFLKRKYTEFYEIVNDILNKKFGWNGIYRGYLISFHGSNIREFAAEHEKEANILKQHNLSLNEKIHDAINRDAQERYDENQKKLDKLAEQVYGELSNMQKREIFLYKDNYLDIQFLLNDKLIKIKH